MGKKQEAQADKEAEDIAKGIGALCSEADDSELDYVIGRLKREQ